MAHGERSLRERRNRDERKNALLEAEGAPDNSHQLFRWPAHPVVAKLNPAGIMEKARDVVDSGRELFEAGKHLVEAGKDAVDLGKRMDGSTPPGSMNMDKARDESGESGAGLVGSGSDIPDVVGEFGNRVAVSMPPSGASTEPLPQRDQKRELSQGYDTEGIWLFWDEEPGTDLDVVLEHESVKVEPGGLPGVSSFDEPGAAWPDGRVLLEKVKQLASWPFGGTPRPPGSSTEPMRALAPSTVCEDRPLGDPPPHEGDTAMAFELQALRSKSSDLEHAVMRAEADATVASAISRALMEHAQTERQAAEAAAAQLLAKLEAEQVRPCRSTHDPGPLHAR